MNELFNWYKEDKANKLKDYLHIIEDSPVYPVIYDSNDVVCSLPPIINGEHSKLTKETRNIFIESTGTDYGKLIKTLNTLIALFSGYCKKPFTVEPVQVIYPDGSKRITPDLTVREVKTDLKYLNTICGFKIDQHNIVELMAKMGIKTQCDLNGEVTCHIPITRSDILHPCDVAEDLCIAYGFNNIEFKLPPSMTIGGETRLNKISDLLREECSHAGFNECLNFALCSKDDISLKLNKELDDEVVVIANPKTIETQCARNTLISGIIKVLSNNKSSKLPLSFFEISDVCKIDPKEEIGALNQRNLVAIYSNTNESGFEIIHGLLDYLMKKMKIPNEKKKGYHITASENKTFFPKMQADVLLEGQCIGTFGILHPDVLKNFGWMFPTSLIELQVEPLIEYFFRLK